MKTKKLSKVWDHRFKIDPKCQWKREDGSLISIWQMNLFHLYHALILVWNHGVPEDYMLPPYNICKFAITRKQRRWYLANLYSELMNRKHELTATQWKVAFQIAQWIAFANKKEAPSSLY